MPKAIAKGAAAPAKPATPPRRAAAPPPETEQEHEHNGDENEGASRADAFDNAPKSANGIPVGDWEARITEMVYQKNEKGESVKVTYEATTQDEESEAYGKSGSQWYQIFDKAGNLGKGVGFLKADLEKLGVDEEGQKFSNLESTLEQITAEQPLVNIRVKQNDQWTNIYLQGLIEGPE